MLNGRDDFIFPLDSVAKPLFALLGAPADRKRHAVHDGGHLPPLNELIRDVLGWFDQDPRTGRAAMTRSLEGLTRNRLW